MNIIEIPNPHSEKVKPIKEKQEIFIPGIINQNIPHKTGFIDLKVGSGGSGKSSNSLNMFQSKTMYRGVFHNIFYFCPMSSFLSVQNHPFEKHDKVYHELTVQNLEEIYQQLNGIKERAEERSKRRKQKALEKKKGVKGVHYEEESESEEDEEDDEVDIQYSCIFIDDFADSLKEKDMLLQLSKMMIKARHICCSFIITLQSYYYFPKILRKQVTNLTIFKPKNISEWISIAVEVLKFTKDDGEVLYDYVFDKQYNHLDVDTNTNTYYKNFNLLQIENTGKHKKTNENDLKK